MIRASLAAFVGVSGASLVLFSAWLSHGANDLPPQTLKNLIIAVSFGFVHILALVSSISLFEQHISAKVASYGFVTGIILFCGSIITKSFLHIGFLANVAPVGGMAFVLGWLCLAISIGKKH
ncbi:DUF423 domain-containing protein [Thalassotalea sp. HSM 43]|uniref:DUF423 domain-containing protein n=1 Tax=Thalassotalea sp. HSM 43 TaxID=2552945 RepID=UPI0010803177|nr:DUF423 domain-containing protein [Thalassotalea sp. HSM 43]QBY03208.1 DUF423 domain-containing protein [Thalassotalea sp. HSM 43]